MASISHSLSHYIVFSYHRNHQELVLKIYQYLKIQNLPVWIDILDGINKDQYNSVREKISGLVCFMTPMYESSKHCQQDILFAKTEGIPIIACRLLPNWKPSGWLNKVTSDLLIIDLQDINQKNFEDKIKKLQEKLNWLLDNGRNSPRIPQSSNLIDSLTISTTNNPDITYDRKQPIKYRILPTNCRLYLSNLMICSNEYILINANNHLHLFDKNLRLIRSNNDIRITESNLQDLCWCTDANSFIILTRKHIYLMNPLTCKLSSIENIKSSDHLEEFLSCTCTNEKLFLLTCQLNTNMFFYHEYNLSTFRFCQKLRIRDLIGTSLLIQNGLFDKYDIQEMISIRYFQQKIAMIMRIGTNWFIYIFSLHEQPILLKEIQLGGRSRMTILNPMNQWILFRDYLSNEFIRINIDLHRNSQMNETDLCVDFVKGFIDFGGQLRSVALFGTSTLVFLIDNTLVLYKL
ncbi:hypothetical protein I4U23_026590 [Adineta vaga]|nr:hypothetical protein I4U23_026590 [Adineta vaga]